MLAPVRDSWHSQQPMRWKRLKNLPRYVFYNQWAHFPKGVGCSSCHGNVALKPLMMQAASVQMEWCLKCHRWAEEFLRPRDQVLNLDYHAPSDLLSLGKSLSRQYHVLSRQMMESCSFCHR